MICSLMEFGRSEEAGTRIKAVCPVCHSERRHIAWTGADDGVIQHRAGGNRHDYENRRLWSRTADRAAE